jgi:hypothetical protein
MLNEEIVERGLIAYCIVFFSECVMLDIAIQEKAKQIADITRYKEDIARLDVKDAKEL